MHLLCPHCKNPIELVKFDPHAEITCTSCGSSFRIDEGSTTGWIDNSAKSIGRFSVIETVGQGGFGTVFKAHDPELDRTVAVKVPRRGNVGEAPQDVDRFLREARSVAQLRHPSIVSVHEVGMLDGTPYLVSDFVEGLTLSDVLTARRPAPREAAKLIAEVADALHHAHQQGVVHRDVKPSNIMVRPDGSPVVMDFGLAKRDAGEITMTMDGQVLGTPAYMSPEQARGEGHRVDGRSDIYSLGVILYLLLTGEMPFHGNTRMLLHQVLHDEPKPPRKLNDKIPRDLETITLKAMAKEPAKRYATAADLASDLRRFLGGEPIVARPVGAIERGMKWVRRNPVVTGLTTAVFLVLLAGTIGIYAKYRDAESARAAEAKRVEERDEAIGKRDQALGKADEALSRRDTAVKDANDRADELRHQLGISNFLLGLVAYENRDAKLAAERLDRVPNEERGWEWHYLKRQTQGGIFTLNGHTAPVTSVAFSPDGQRIVTGSGDNTAKIWDAKTGSPLVDLKGHTKLVTSVAFSPDSQWIVTGSYDNTAKVWDARTGTPLAGLKGHTERVTSVAFSPDSQRIVTGSWDETAKVWDARTGTLLVDLKGHAGEVSSVAFSPDGQRIVTGSWDETAKVWDAKTGTPLVDLKGHSSGVNGVAFSPDGQRIVSGSYDRTAKVWDAMTGTPLVELKGHINGVMSVSFSADGARIVTGSYDKTAKVWDARIGTPLVDLKGHTHWVVSVAFSPDGARIVTGSYDKTAKVWDARIGTPLVDLKGHTHWVVSVAFSPDGQRIVTGSWDKKAKVWDAKTGTPLIDLKGHTSYVTRVAFSPDGQRIVTGSADKTAKVWDAKAGTLLVDLKGHTSVVRGVAFSPDSQRIVTGSDDRTAKVWDAKTGTPLLDLKHTSDVKSVAFSPNGQRIVTGSEDNTAKVWDAETGTPLFDLKGHTKVVASVAFSPNGQRIVTGSEDNTAKVWDAKTGTPLFDLKGHTKLVASVAFSPNGQRIVTGSEDNTAKVWDAKTGTPLFDLKGHTKLVASVAFCPDGQRIVTGSLDKTAKVWDYRGGNTLDGGNWDADELDYRLFHTQPTIARYQVGYETASQARDPFAMRFYLDRLWAMPPYVSQKFRDRFTSDPDPRLTARAAFHQPELAKTPYDRGIVHAMAIASDPLSQRLVAQQLIRDGQSAKAIPLLHACMLSRWANRPPVEELLIAKAYLNMNNQAETKRYYKAATDWLDRPRNPMRAANIVTHAINPWNAIGEAFKPIDDPRHNTFDWESWHECDVFRAEVEKRLFANRQ